MCEQETLNHVDLCNEVVVTLNDGEVIKCKRISLDNNGLLGSFLSDIKNGDIKEGPTYIFDFGMHPVMKKTILSLVKNPIYINEEDNMRFISFILRVLIIEHTLTHDHRLLFEVSQMDTKKLKDDNILNVFSGVRYYEASFLKGFFHSTKQKDLFNNLESNDLIELVNKYK